MPAEHRRVTVAPGHAVLVRRLRDPANRAGYVRVQTKGREVRSFDIPEPAWAAAEIHHAS